MGIRVIRELGDEALYKRSREVTEITPHIHALLDDMAKTMYAAEGAGLAAPQVGILRRVVVIDVGDGLIELINPEIVETEGSQTGEEGCLSVPGRRGVVTRPYRVTVKALNRDGEEIEITGDAYLARAFCHELDHLDGKLYVDKIERELEDDDKFEDIIEFDGEPLEDEE